MLRLLKFLFTGDWHLHEWETIQVDSRKRSGSGYNQEYIQYHMKCKHCGNLKFVDSISKQ